MNREDNGLIKEVKQSNRVFKMLMLFCFFMIVLLTIFSFSEFNDYYYMIPTGDWIFNNGIMRTHPFTIDEFPVVIQQWAYCVYLYFLSPLVKWGVFFSVCLFLFLLGFVVFKYLKIYAIDNLYIYFVIFFSFYFSFFYVFKIRPETLTFVLLFAEIYFLKKYQMTQNWKYLLSFPLLLLLESNFHGSMWMFHYLILIPFLIPSFGFFTKPDDVIENRKIPILISVLSFSMVLSNPYGFGLVRYTYDSFFSGSLEHVTEMERPEIYSIYGFIILIVFCLFLFLIVNRSISSVTFYTSLGFLFLSVLAMRNGMFLIVPFVMLSKDLYLAFNINFNQAFLTNSVDVNVFDKKFNVGLFGSIFLSLILILVLLTSSSFISFVNNDWIVPKSLQNIRNDLASEGVKKNDHVLTIFEFGSFLEYCGYQNIYTDSRPELYAKKLNHKRDYFDYLTDGEYISDEKIESLLDEYNFKAVVLNSVPYRYAYYNYLEHSKDWKYVGRYDYFVLFVKQIIIFIRMIMI